ncbi:MAG: sulfurtransferase-like selenium metabolism protein YedF [Desulfobacteraceae bacterium]|nr:sulfurtransferase-like selenium metabolism protein YedF [Desulfobacteraceae bacterium]
MSEELDCRGLACPGPVMQIKERLEQTGAEAFVVTVDNEAAWENVSRFLEYQGFQVTTERRGEDIRVSAVRQGAAPGAPVASEPARRLPERGAEGKRILIMVGTDRLGHGDDELGAGLLLNFLKTVKEMGPELWRLIFVNRGVTLATEGSEALPALLELAERGVKIMVCGTCLNHFKLLEKKRVGETTNMLDIVTAMQCADSVINI